MQPIVAIGALGGSGTRAVAEILIQAGVYMGRDRNDAQDNLLFTRLFKNPQWHESATPADVKKRLTVFKKCMEGSSLNTDEIGELWRASRDNPTFKTSFLHRASEVMVYAGFHTARTKWGWKEPNTHIFLPELINFFPRLKYIHVLRHGLDMAFSDNHQQLNNWGHCFDLNLSGKESDQELAVQQLEYWIRSTKRVLTMRESVNERIMILNHSELIQSPERTVSSLLEFAEIELSDAQLKRLYQIPHRPSSMDRYKKHELNGFSEQQIDFVRTQGFTV